MNGADRKLLRGCITCGTDYLMTIQFNGKIFLQLILLGVLSRLEDFSGKISMETESIELNMGPREEASCCNIT